jgi:hypothetical protein
MVCSYFYLPGPGQATQDREPSKKTKKSKNHLLEAHILQLQELSGLHESNIGRFNMKRKSRPASITEANQPAFPEHKKGV